MTRRLPLSRSLALILAVLAALLPLLAAVRPAGAQSPAPPPQTPSGTAQPAAPVAQTLPAPAFAVQAKSAVLVDFNSGQTLLAQNPDLVLPPASLTKIMTLYLAFSDIKAGKARLDDPVQISRRAWAQNPELKDSSLMFLEPGQRVTLREILLGVAVASGNDASVALAEHLNGSVEAFVARMNEQAKAMGLKDTYFVDPHGLSEQNRSTARDLATMAVRYIREFPEALAMLHSVKEFSYPQPHNLSDEQRARGGQQPIPQANRNRLLWSFPGADGLKTGFVSPQYGYNLIATAKRGDQRLVAVILGAASDAEREAQGIALLTHGFTTWSSVLAFKGGEAPGQPVSVRVWKGEKSQVALVAARDLWVAVPKGQEGALVRVVQAQPAAPVLAPVAKGQPLGKASVALKDQVVAEVDLVAQEEVRAGGLLRRLWDSLVLLLDRLWHLVRRR